MLTKIFYKLRPIIPRLLQIFLRRKLARYKLVKYRNVWPIDFSSATPPAGWSGWPDGKQFALILSHDVDTQKGHDNVMRLLGIEQSHGFRSAFNIVPERYNIGKGLIDDIRNEGFEVNVHGLKHDGMLFSSKEIFQERANRINHYLRQWRSSGFTAPSMHHELSWLHQLDIIHSTSTFDTDPFEPQPDGVHTIFPFWVKNETGTSGYLELPYTLAQDHLLFVILREKTIDIWKKKLAWVAKHGGMALVNTHTDYMNFDGTQLQNEEYPVSLFEELLVHIKNEYSGNYYHALPDELTEFWKKTYVRQ